MRRALIGKKKALGIDIGASKIEWALFEGGKIRATQKFTTPKNMDNERLMGTIFEIIRATKPHSVGIAAPGYCAGGKIIYLPNMPKVGLLLVEKSVKKHFGIEAYLQNDIKCASLAHWAAQGRKKDASFIMVAPGTGIGGAIVHNGRLVGGKNNTAGEFGHMKIYACHEKKACLIEWEQICSGRGIEKTYYQMGGKEGADAKFILNSKSPLARKICLGSAYHFGIGLANLANALNPQEIVVCGSVGNKYLTSYEKAMRQGFLDCAIEPVQNTGIKRAKFENPMIVGALLLAMQNKNSSIKGFLSG